MELGSEACHGLSGHLSDVLLQNLEVLPKSPDKKEKKFISMHAHICIQYITISITISRAKAVTTNVISFI